jgi:large subunit ribosomal protein L25
METLIIEVEGREAGGKGAARRIRGEGKMPAVFYGPNSPARSIAVNAHEFNKRVAHLEGSHLLELRSRDSGLDQRKVLLRDIQFDPVAGVAMHADFYEVALDRAIEVKVPLHFEGKAAGVTLGGILQPIMREVTVSCLPTAIPEFIAVDVTAIGIHESIHLNDLQMPQGAEIVSRDNDPVVTVLPPSIEAKPAEEEAAAAEGAAAAAPAEGAAPAEAGAKKPEGKKAEEKK